MSLNENQWAVETFEHTSAFGLRYTNKLKDCTSPYQRIEIFETETMGRALVLNGCFMVTEGDAFIYHEMLVHPAMHTIPSPRNVLVIGGGDGGAVTEVVKYPHVERVVLCEIDSQVIDACTEHFPLLAAGLSDPRAEVMVADGAEYARNHAGAFDLVIVDSTDPVGPGKALYEITFFEAVRNCLTSGGAAVFQTESPLFMKDVFRDTVFRLSRVFDGKVSPYLAIVPCYPGALWSFTFCSADCDLIRDARPQSDPALTNKMRYYSPAVHRAAGVLPPFVARLLEP